MSHFVVFTYTLLAHDGNLKAESTEKQGKTAIIGARQYIANTVQYLNPGLIKKHDRSERIPKLAHTKKKRVTVCLEYNRFQ